MNPGTWQQYVQRPDNRGLSITLVERKYMQEQHQFQMMLMESAAAAAAASSAGGGGGNTAQASVVITDSDVLAFVAASGITDNTQKSAVNTLVTSLKGYSIWTKLNAIYPFVGGTASTHKWNLKDPRDLDAAYRLSFSGGWTHNSNGVTGNGTNTYADTFYNPQPINTIGVYSRNNGSGYIFGQTGIYDGDEASSSEFGFLMYPGNLTNVFENLITTNAPHTRGVIITNTGGSSTTAVKVYSDGTNLNRTHATNYWAAQGYNSSNFQPLLFGANRLTYYSWPDGIPTPGSIYGYNNQNQAFAFIGNTALTATEALNLNTAMVAYQTTLGRQV